MASLLTGTDRSQRRHVADPRRTDLPTGQTDRSGDLTRRSPTGSGSALTIVAHRARRSPRVYRFTRFGMATRAVGGDRDRCAGQRHLARADRRSPTGRSAPWSPEPPASSSRRSCRSCPGTYTLFIVPALAAAVLGRFSAFAPGDHRRLRHRHAAVAGRVPADQVQLVPVVRGRRADPADPVLACSSCAASPCRPAARSSSRPSAARRVRVASSSPAIGRIGGGPRAARRPRRQLPVGADHHARSWRSSRCRWSSSPATAARSRWPR